MAVGRVLRGREHRGQLARDPVHGALQHRDADRRADRAGAVLRDRGGRAAVRARARASRSTRSTTPTRSRSGLVFSAVSIAVLSFLGFDGISTLAEENREGARRIGRAMLVALAIVGVLFVVQTWIAALLVPDPEGLIAERRPGGHRVLRRRGGRRRALAERADGGGDRDRVGDRQRARRPRRRPRGCCTRWRATASSRTSSRSISETPPRAGERDAAGGRRVARRGDLDVRARRRHHDALDAGQLRRAERVPAAAPVGAAPLRDAPRRRARSTRGAISSPRRPEP